MRNGYCDEGKKRKKKSQLASWTVEDRSDWKRGEEAALSLQSHRGPGRASDIISSSRDGFRRQMSGTVLIHSLCLVSTVCAPLYAHLCHPTLGLYNLFPRLGAQVEKLCASTAGTSYLAAAAVWDP